VANSRQGSVSREITAVGDVENWRASSVGHERQLRNNESYILSNHVYLPR
jgi:hypothetical protein